MLSLTLPTSIHHVFPGPERRTGIRDYALLLQQMFDRSEGPRLQAVDPGDDWCARLERGSLALVQLGINEHSVYRFLADSARRRPDLRRVIVLHDPPQFCHSKTDAMERLARWRAGRALRRIANRLFADALDRRILRPQDTWVALSSVGRDAVAARLGRMGIAEPMVHDVPLGLYRDIPIPVVTRDDSLLRAGFFGFIAPSKGLHLLVEAVEIIKRERGDLGRLRFIIAGEPDSRHSAGYLDGLRRRIASSGLDQAFEFHPRIDDDALPSFVANLDILALPYLRPAGLSASGPMHWAWTMGVPVLASATPYFREKLESAGAGILAPIGDARGWAERLLRLDQDRTLLPDLRKAVGKAREHCSWRATVEAYCKAFHHAGANRTTMGAC